MTIVCGGHRATGLATLQWHRYYRDWHEIHFGLWPIRETARPIAKVRPGETIWHLSWPRKTTVQSTRWHWLLVNAAKSRHLNHIFSQQPVSILWSFSTNKCCHTAAGIGNRKLCANELASKKCKCKELLEKKGLRWDLYNLSNAPLTATDCKLWAKVVSRPSNTIFNVRGWQKLDNTKDTRSAEMGFRTFWSKFDWRLKTNKSIYILMFNISYHIISFKHVHIIFGIFIIIPCLSSTDTFLFSFPNWRFRATIY